MEFLIIEDVYNFSSSLKFNIKADLKKKKIKY